VVSFLSNLGPAEVGEVEALELEAEVLADQRAAGQSGDVAEHRLAAIAEAGSLRRTDVEHAAELVDDERRKGVAIDVLSDDQKRLARLRDLLQERQKVTEVRDFLLVNQNERVVELAEHLGRLVDEVGGDEALVELHPVDEADGRLGGLAFFDGDHAVLAHLLQGLGEQVADRPVVVGADRADLGNLLRPRDAAGHLHETLHCRSDTLLDAPANGRGIRAGRHVPRALTEDRPGEDGGRGRTVTGQI